jgi:hypothetical protein
MKRLLVFFLVGVGALLSCGGAVKAKDRRDCTDIQFAGSSSAHDVSISERIANSQTVAVKAKRQLEKLVGPMKYSDGTSEVRSITIEEDADTDITGNVAVFVNLRKTEITEELNAKMPPIINGITIRLRLPGNIVPSYGAHFDLNIRR